MLFSPFGDHFPEGRSREGTYTVTRTAIPDRASLRGVSPGCLALLVGILRSTLSTAVCTIVPEHNVAAETQPLDES